MVSVPVLVDQNISFNLKGGRKGGGGGGCVEKSIGGLIKLCFIETGSYVKQNSIQKCVVIIKPCS